MLEMNKSLLILKSIWREYCDFFSVQDKTSKFFALFWLSGPFILLIERSPADAWLTLCGLGFLVYCLRTKNINWLSFFWVKSVIAFWLICIISALSSELVRYSLGEALIWVRFPIFAFACCFWLGKDRRALNAMYLSVGLAMLVMGVILIAEFIVREESQVV